VLFLAPHGRIAPNRDPQNAQNRHRIPFAEWTEALDEAGHVEPEPRRLQVRVDCQPRRPGRNGRRVGNRLLHRIVEIGDV
jgi:hypothetical protein